MQFSCGDAPLHEIGVSIPQAVWIACNFLFLKGSDQMNTVSIPQAVWIACNLDEWYPLLPTERVSIPQAVWIACNFAITIPPKVSFSVSIPQAVWIACNLQKDESGQDGQVSIPQAVWIACNLNIIISHVHEYEFQYRKRYGLHAISSLRRSSRNQRVFQYRKRYGLHAILSPGSLGNSEPRSRFSDTDPLFAFFPKCAELFCREKCFERGLKPVIARALLSTKEI